MTVDAFSAAGYVVCPRSGAVAWPVDAAWLDDDLLVASFPAPECEGCSHTDDVRIIRPSTLPVSERCTATTRAGRRCTRRVAVGAVCAVHARSGAAR